MPTFGGRADPAAIPHARTRDDGGAAAMTEKFSETERELLRLAAELMIRLAED
jgi:hypothetical protein